MLPFPSHEIDPYRGLSPHFDIASARARALHALSRVRRGWSLRRRRRCCRDSQPPAALEGHRAPLHARRRDFADRSRRPSRRRRLHAAGSDRRARRVLRSRRRRRLLSRRRAPADPARVHRRHHRVAPHLRPRHAAVDRGDRSGADRPAAGAWIFRRRRKLHGAASALGHDPRLRRPASSRRHRLRAGRSQGGDREAARADRAQLRGEGPEERARPPSRRRSSWPGKTCAPMLEAADRLETLALGTEDEVRHVATQPAMEFSGRVADWVGELRSRAAGRRNRGLRRATPPAAPSG